MFFKCLFMLAMLIGVSQAEAEPIEKINSLFLVHALSEKLIAIANNSALAETENNELTEQYINREIEDVFQHVQSPGVLARVALVCFVYMHPGYPEDSVVDRVI